MENNTQLKEMIRSMVIDILQGQKQEMASSQPIKHKIFGAYYFFL